VTLGWEFNIPLDLQFLAMIMTFQNETPVAHSRIHPSGAHGAQYGVLLAATEGGETTLRVLFPWRRGT